MASLPRPSSDGRLRRSLFLGPLPGRPGNNVCPARPPASLAPTAPVRLPPQARLSSRWLGVSLCDGDRHRQAHCPDGHGEACGFVGSGAVGPSWLPAGSLQVLSPCEIKHAWPLGNKPIQRLAWPWNPQVGSGSPWVIAGARQCLPLVLELFGGCEVGGRGRAEAAALGSSVTLY